MLPQPLVLLSYFLTVAHMDTCMIIINTALIMAIIVVIYAVTATMVTTIWSVCLSHGLTLHIVSLLLLLSSPLDASVAAS